MFVETYVNGVIGGNSGLWWSLCVHADGGSGVLGPCVGAGSIEQRCSCDKCGGHFENG